MIVILDLVVDIRDYERTRSATSRRAIFERTEHGPVTVRCARFERKRLVNWLYPVALLREAVANCSLR